MTKPDLNEFIAAAQDFRAFCEAEGKATRADLWTVRAILLRLIYHAPAAEQSSQSCDHEVSRCSDESWKLVFHRCAGFPFDYYNLHLKPFEIPSDEVGIGSLCDDLADIYRDLCEGLDLYAQGYLEDACFYWALNYRSHWSIHALQALSALELYRTDNYLNTSEDLNNA